MYKNGFKFFVIKILAAILSALAFSIFAAWRIYTPLADRLENIEYHSFSGLFAFNVVPNFFIFFILGIILSPVVDSIVLYYFSVKGIKGSLIMILAYLLLGVTGGIFISLFFLRTDYISYYISVSIVAAMIFLVIQSLLNLIFNRRRK